MHRGMTELQHKPHLEIQKNEEVHNRNTKCCVKGPGTVTV